MIDGKNLVSRVADSRYFAFWVFGFEDLGSDFNAGCYRSLVECTGQNDDFSGLG